MPAPPSSILLVAKKGFLANNGEFSKAEEELLFTSIEESNCRFGIIASAFHFDDFANAEAFMLDLLAYADSWGVARRT